MIVTFKFILLTTGLLLPGYLLGRLLRLQQPWLVAFPFSALVLVEAVIVFTLLGLPLDAATMGIALSAAALVILGLRWLVKPVEDDTGCFSRPPFSSLLAWSTLGMAAGIFLVVAVRTTLFPLSGFDTFFRWEALAREMLVQRSLAFYPPVQSGDYVAYLYTDGIPPLVASVYWWMYAILGEALPPITSLSTMLQLATTVALVFFAARQTYGLRSAWFALLVATISPLLLNAFAIGQETGFTTLAVAGQICFALAAVRTSNPSYVVAVALFAGVGALARDYGPAYAVVGFSILAWAPQTRRYLGGFLLVFSLCALPWYLRSWATTGNPFFPHPLPGFSTNAVHAALHAYYQEIFSLGKQSPLTWLLLGRYLLLASLLPLLVGVSYGVMRTKEVAPLLVATAAMVLLWAYSVGQTSGGILYSTRILAPATIPLTVLAGAAFGRITEPLHGRKWIVGASGLMLVFYSCYALLVMVSHPLPTLQSPSFLFSKRDNKVIYAVQDELASRLQASEMADGYVLTDDVYFATILKRNTRFKPMMIWNPKVQYVFDHELPCAEIYRRLREDNVKFVTLSNQGEHKTFLLRFPFYQCYKEWTLFTHVDFMALFTLP